MSSIINASTSGGLIQSADTSGVLQLQSGGTTQFTVDSTGAYGTLERGTQVTASSTTSLEFTGIPSWAKRITVMLNGISASSTGTVQIQLGTSSGYEITGYTSIGSGITSVVGTSNITTGFQLSNGSLAAETAIGIMTLFNITGNTYVTSGTINLGTKSGVFGGSKSLSGTLDRVRVIASATGSPADTIDAGSINIMYEG